MVLIVWKTVFEVGFSILIILGIIAVGSFFVVKSLSASFKEVFKYQSKFDIELRKSLNLLSKVIVHPTLSEYLNMNIKELTNSEKKNIMLFVDEIYLKIDTTLPSNQYIVETYENLQELRRVRDSLVLIFNQKILMFPFNVYARLLKMKKWDIYTKE